MGDFVFLKDGSLVTQNIFNLDFVPKHVIESKELIKYPVKKPAMRATLVKYK